MNANLSYMLSRVSSVSTQTFKLDPQNSTSSSAGQTVRCSLPSNTLLTLKSIRMICNVTTGGSGARLPPKINSLSDRVSLEAGGVIISGSAYAHANLGTEGHTRIIRYLVNKGANINNFSKNGNTALMFAAR